MTYADFKDIVRCWKFECDEPALVVTATTQRPTCAKHALDGLLRSLDPETLRRVSEGLRSKLT